MKLYYFYFPGYSCISAAAAQLQKESMVISQNVEGWVISKSLHFKTLLIKKQIIKWSEHSIKWYLQLPSQKHCSDSLRDVHNPQNQIK